MNASHLTDRSLETLLMTVKSQSQRWRRLDVTIPSNFEEILFSPLRMKDIAILEHASIRTWESSSNHARNELQFSLSAAPRLECVVLRSNIRVTFDGPVQHSLKHLTFHRDYDVKTHQADLGACLKQYPFLQTLSYPLHSSSLPKTLPAILNHTHIQSLNLRIHMGCDLGLLFHHLILPALTDLVLDIEDDWIPKKNWPHLLTLLKHSRPPLTSLTLIGFPTMERNLIECLKCTTDLRKLTACAVGCTDATLEALTCLDLGVDSCFSLEAMKALILSRWPGHSHGSHSSLPGKELTELWASYKPDVNNILTDPAIAKCISEGFCLDFEWW
ncbi:hypothetical protein BD410DRAFT_792267 [Rickenella mellea]|uniref:F-box domain-containing protein n=1 Tax=Rickenella mellea TaxID=50990 RepID=A0A4Y7PXI3_9AGAM|nr:hypothetical protein BD410DRAFT_792267 [Rickenella mellea]